MKCFKSYWFKNIQIKTKECKSGWKQLCGKRSGVNIDSWTVIKILRNCSVIISRFFTLMSNSEMQRHTISIKGSMYWILKPSINSSIEPSGQGEISNCMLLNEKFPHKDLSYLHISLSCYKMLLEGNKFLTLFSDRPKNISIVLCCTVK